MTKRKQLFAMLVAGLVGGVGLDAAAEPPARHGAARDEARADKRDGRRDAHEGLKDIGDERKAAHEPLAQKVQRMRDTRDERRREHRVELQRRWGADVAQHPAWRAELRAHAWRAARLHRIRMLAEASGKVDLAARANRLLVLEELRHDRQMLALGAKVQAPEPGGPTAASSGGAP